MSPIATRRRIGWAVVLGLVLLVWGGLVGRAESPQITDIADDAYRYPDTPLGQPGERPAIAPLSNETADILSVTLSRAAPLNPNHDSAYSVALTVKGAPHPSYNYLVGGMFGEDCYLISFLKAGETRKAMAWCGNENGRLIGSLEGSTVTIKGNTISATYSFRRFALPSPLKKNSMLEDLYAMSCPVTSNSWGCNDDVIDWAFSDTSTFAI